jgi:hypothetical protein
MLCCRMNTWYVGRLSSYPGDHFAAGRYCHRAKERRESQMIDCVVRGRRKKSSAGDAQATQWNAPTSTSSPRSRPGPGSPNLELTDIVSLTEGATFLRLLVQYRFRIASGGRTTFFQRISLSVAW